jgi:hypothetical protein
MHQRHAVPATSPVFRRFKFRNVTLYWFRPFFLSTILHDSTFNILATKFRDNRINCPVNVTELPQLHEVVHLCFSFCFCSSLTLLCCVRCCGATEHIMLSTTAMPSAEILKCCYSLSHSVSCILEIRCCDCHDLPRYVKAECFSVLLHFMDINHWLPWSWDLNIAKWMYSLRNK